MSIFDSLFGGTEDYQLPGSEEYIDPIANWDPRMYGLRLGMGPVGRAAKQDFKDLRAGKDISSIAGFSPTLGAINSSYASGDKVRNRQIGANLALLNQPTLMAAMQSEGQRGSDQDRSNTIAQQAAGFYNNTANTLNTAWNGAQDRRAQAARDKLSAREAAAQAFYNSWRQKQKKGILGGLAEVAGAFTGAATGLNSLGSVTSIFDKGLRANDWDPSTQPFQGWKS